MSLNEISVAHHAWVGAMNWHNRTPLEAAGMIASEIGEVAGEIMPLGITGKFSEEVSDVVLRCLDYFIEAGHADIEIHLSGIESTFVAFKSNKDCHLELSVLQSKLINAVRVGAAEDELDALLSIIKKCFEIAARNNIDLLAAIEAKVSKNIRNGSKGRSI